MPLKTSRQSDLENKSRLILGVGLLSIGLAWLLQLLWPILLLVGVSIGSYWIWLTQYKRLLAYQQQEERLLDQFCYLLEQRQGRISALEFAMHSRVEKRAAQRYLHSQAQSFGAFFERTVHGDIIYIFNLAVVYSLEPAYAPPAAYANPTITPSQPYRQSPHQSHTAAETAWTYAQQTAQQRQAQQRLRPQTHSPTQRPDDKLPLTTVRGRAVDSSDNIITIDVAAVNE